MVETGERTMLTLTLSTLQIIKFDKPFLIIFGQIITIQVI